MNANREPMTEANAAKGAGFIKSLTDRLTPRPPREPDNYDRSVLFGMSKLQHVYAGTVPAATKAKRRAAGKVAKASRKINRGSNRGR